MNATTTFTNQYARYIPGIDGLRAIAVLSVILFHIQAKLMPGGFSGVDVFFVISGYVVSGSLAKESLSSFWRFSVSFYARRIIRIYPALVACLLVVALLQVLIIPSSWLSTTSNKTAISAFFGLSNYALILLNDGYFSPRVEFNPFTHTWSLAVEEQFYLFFPLIFFIWLKGRDKKGAIGAISNWLLVVLFVISLLFSWHQTTSSPDYAYYLLPSRFWELGCGSILFILHARGRFVARSQTTQSGCVVFGLLLIFLALALSDPRLFPFPWAILSVAGSLFVIAGVTSNASEKSLINRVLDNSLIVYIGKISYSLYLWHWPIIVMFRWTIGLEKPLAIYSAITLTFLVSIFSFHFIERPIRKSKFVISKTDWYAVSRGVMVVVISSMIAIGIFISQPYLSFSVTKDRSNWYPEDWPSMSATFDTQQSPLRDHKIFVLGDSHAGAYSTMLQMLKEEQGVQIHQYSKGGCPVAGLLRKSSIDCAQFIEKTAETIKKEASHGDFVFLASLRMNRLGDQWATFDESLVKKKQSGPESIKQRAAALKEAELLIGGFEKAGLIVVIDAPKPIFKSPPFRCSDWFNVNNPVCKGGASISRTFLLNHRQPVMESIQQLASQHPRLAVWDPFPILCPDELCTAFDKQLPMFFDGDHLSGHGNRILYPSFLSFLKQVLEKNS